MKWMTGVLIAAMLGGCSLTREVPPSQSYHLEGLDIEPVASQCGNSRVIRVALIRGAQTLEGTAIYYAGVDGKTYIYTQARWEMPPVEQLQHIVERSVVESGLFSGVIPYKSLAKNDWLLELRIERMMQQIDAKGQGETVLMLYGVLIDQFSRRIIAQKTFRYSYTSEQADVQSAVNAWNRSVQTFLPEFVTWLRQECEAHPKVDRSDVDL